MRALRVSRSPLTPLPLGEGELLNDKLKFVGHQFLVSSVRQHSSNPLEVAVRNQNINVQIALPLDGLLRQDVACVRMAPLDLTGGRNAKTLCRSLMCL